ncbi:hypothetical protein [Treponema endosymbiont of Eucomonympha sp.]|uniref:hypothetical protein n=1 Tax=Treponema endosymbiont of Eucomonympha sp. TaxID=1580831 RepID=UPI000785C4D2|nr:hypothetical protein [Treponema endosymbiont of Eucomonympha sp.]
MFLYIVTVFPEEKKMTTFKKAAASVASVIAVAGLGAALYSCGSPASSPSGDISKGNPDRRSYYNHIWLEGPAGKTEFDENSVWGADEWEKLFHAFKRGDKSFKYGFNGDSYQGRYERHLRDAGIPYIRKNKESNVTIVDVTKIISMAGREHSVIFGWDIDWK